MNLSVTLIMAEFDEKASSYGRGVIRQPSKSEERFSFFSNNDELNATRKRVRHEKKCGDQTSIVDYINFYKIND